MSKSRLFQTRQSIQQKGVAFFRKVPGRYLCPFPISVQRYSLSLRFYLTHLFLSRSLSLHHYIVFIKFACYIYIVLLSFNKMVLHLLGFCIWLTLMLFTNKWIFFCLSKAMHPKKDHHFSDNPLLLKTLTYKKKEASFFFFFHPLFLKLIKCHKILGKRRIDLPPSFLP